jgi:hypothetical protein
MSYLGRKFPRYSFEIKVKVKTPEDEIFVMKTINISEQGLKLISQDKYIIIEPQSIISIALGDEKINIEGEIRHFSTEESGETVFGIQISEESSEWKKYFDSILKENKPDLEL